VSSGYISGSDSLGYSLVLPELSVSELLAEGELRLELVRVVWCLFLRWRRWASWEFVDAVPCSEFEELDTEETGLEGSEGAEGLLWDVEEFAVG